jgi:hypothetical protein
MLRQSTTKFALSVAPKRTQQQNILFFGYKVDKKEKGLRRRRSRFATHSYKINNAGGGSLEV